MAQVVKPRSIKQVYRVRIPLKVTINFSSNKGVQISNCIQWASLHLIPRDIGLTTPSLCKKSNNGYSDLPLWEGPSSFKERRITIVIIITCYVYPRPLMSIVRIQSFQLFYPLFSDIVLSTSKCKRIGNSFVKVTMYSFLLEKL